eukprot:TRINITY_DN4233_c0_g1_i2.p1 TRINITY_DN4233_c0_g1~~TRINITY_DN4233_c0_g1_i2.p1  ORF type:complete len:258 (-),score=25.98 TRINITY_DN4233_c0_g1_i2:374-1147(-)
MVYSMRRLDEGGILQTYSFWNRKLTYLQKNTTIDQDLEIRPGLHKSWTRFMQSGSRVDIDAQSADADTLSKIRVCAMESSLLATWLKTETDTGCPSELTSITVVENPVAESSKRQFNVQALATDEFTILLEFPPDRTAEEDANSEEEAAQRPGIDVSVQLRVSLMLIDLREANDFYVGSFVRDLELMESNRPLLVFNNPSSKRSFEVSVRLLPRQLPWILLFVSSQIVFFIVAWLAYRFLSARWMAELNSSAAYRNR